MSNSIDKTEITKTYYTVKTIISNSLLNYVVLFAVVMILFMFVSANHTVGYTYEDVFVLMATLTEVNNNKQCKRGRTADGLNGGARRGGANAVSGAMSDLSKAAESIESVGKQIGKITSDAKYEVDHANYIKDTVGKFTETYCAGELDKMSLMGTFFFVLYSSFIACYNAMQMLNTAIVKCLYLDWVNPRYYLGIMFLYIFFLMAANGSVGMLEALINYISVDTITTSDKYINTIIYSLLSGLVAVFFLYFMIGIMAYITYLAYGMFNILSDVGIRFKLVYLFFLFMIPTSFGFSFIS